MIRRVLLAPALALLLGAGVVTALPSPAQAANGRVDVSDGRGDVVVEKRHFTNRKVDMRDATTWNRSPQLSPWKDQPRLITSRIRLRDVTGSKHRVRQNVAVEITTNRRKFLFSASTYGDRIGKLTEVLAADGVYRNIPWTCSGPKVRHNKKSNAIWLGVPKNCLRGNRIKKVTYFAWQSGDVNPRRPRAADNFAWDGVSTPDINLWVLRGR